MGEGGKKDQRIKLVDAFENSEHFVVLTPFLITEISTHLADWFLLKKVIQSGHSYRKFGSERKNHDLTSDEKNKIDDVISNVAIKDFVNVVTIDEIKKPDLDLLFTLTNNQASFYDSIHVMTAKSLGCEYFITSDIEIRKRAQQIINDGILKNIRLSTPTGFLKIMKNKKL